MTVSSTQTSEPRTAISRVSSNDIETRVELSRASQRQRILTNSTTDHVAIAVFSATERDTGKAPLDRVYPHLFDETGIAGAARIHLAQALKDAQLALLAFGEADFDTLGTRLTLVATSMAAAHRHTEFNENIGAVASYIRRAALTAASADVSRAALNALVNSIESVLANPSMDLDEAAELTERLECEGWTGDHELVSQLIEAMLGDTNAPEVHQGVLFREGVVSEQTS
jgi:hypothetical protein